MPSDSPIFVTGATGYIGGRLVPLLLERGYRVRCLVRSPRKLEARPWRNDPDVEIVAGNVDDIEATTEALRGCESAYYLVHSMIAAGKEYSDRDYSLAEHFAEACERAGTRRIVYLGGLGELGDNLSEHLRSRREVETALSSGSTPVTTLRAAMIIGSGSASFEILRYLVERLPIMVTPRWVQTETQPIAVRNVLAYLIECLRHDETIGQTFDIGGPDVFSYRGLMQIMADERGLSPRIILPVPVLTPRLSSLWIDLVTPVDRWIARPLAEGLRNRTVCREERIRAIIPQDLLGVREAIASALGKVKGKEIDTNWSMAGEMPGDPDWSGGKVFVDARHRHVEATAHDVFKTVCRLGGDHGYYATDWLWRIRGMMDKVVGGPGLRRGRRDPDDVQFGEAIDFWRVGGIEVDRRLTLRAEMKLPGIAELDFEIVPESDASCRLAQTARFRPKGLAGILYWYSVLPLHGFVFNSLLDGLKREAEER